MFDLAAGGGDQGRGANGGDEQAGRRWLGGAVVGRWQKRRCRREAEGAKRGSLFPVSIQFPAAASSAADVSFAGSIESGRRSARRSVRRQVIET